MEINNRFPSKTLFLSAVLFSLCGIGLFKLLLRNVDNPSGIMGWLKTKTGGGVGAIYPAA